MQFALPSLLTMIVALMFAFAVVPRFAPATLAAIAIVAIVIVGYNHYTLFREEYQNMTWVQYAQSMAPYILVGTVFLFIFGFLLLLLGRSKAPRPVGPPGTIPPPETATNFVTEAIGNGLNRMGMVNIGNSTRSLISTSPSVKNEYGSSTIRSAVENRLERAV